MSNRRRLLWKYAAFSALSLLACVAITIALLPKDEEESGEGLVTGVTDDLGAEIPAGAPGLKFTAVPMPFRHFPGARSHRLPEDMGSGVCIEDLDGDGRPDLLLCNNGPLDAEPPPPEAYRNLGDFRFERVETPLPRMRGMGVAAADYDADGDIDLYLTGYGANVLLRNDGGFRFTDVTGETGTAGGGFSSGACWGDADSDGDLDLYVCRYVRFEGLPPEGGGRRGEHTLPPTLNPSAYPAEDNLLYLNEGGRFREAAREMAVANPGGKSLCAVFADFDGDGTQDIYVANDVSDNAMFRGRRGQPFEDVTHYSCTADWRGAMGLAIGDPDRDADLDLFITHWVSEENTLYVKEPGDLLFADRAMESGLGPPSRPMVGWATDFADFDNDGRPDLFVVNGSTFEEADSPSLLIRMPLMLFWNAGRRFHDLAPVIGGPFANPIVGRGGSAGDLDGDGDVDLVVMVLGEAPLLLRNDTEKAGGFLDVEVRGAAPNVFGYGAMVAVEAGGATQVQQVGTKVSYLSSGPRVLHFGLGAADKADLVTVRFSSGALVERRNVRAGTRLVVREFDPRTLGPKMDEARDLLASGRRAEAEAVYRDVLRMERDHANALYFLAQLVTPEEALALCERLLRIEPMLPRGHLLRAAILSDPKRPAAMDLDLALVEVRRAQSLNRDETGGTYEEGRILLLRGEVAEAARVLERIAQNPHAAALAALCHLREGNPAAAARLLGRQPGKAPKDLLEEGDTAHKKADDRALINRLLDFGENDRFRLTKLPLPAMEGAWCSLAPGEARVAGKVVDLKTLEIRDGSASPPPPPVTPYSFDEAAAFALDPPATCAGPPPGATATCEADADGDGDLDLFVACGGDDPAAPLPWWLLLREADHYCPVRGSLPEPGFRVAALSACDIDGDGRAEVLLKGGGFLPHDTGTSWLATLVR